jgi:hypothetical protein
MAAATSPSTGRTYGVRRVCAIWGVPRSSFYDAQRQDARPPERPAGRPGPKPAPSDAELLAAIRRDLHRSPWSGEGHRKVWARLRGIDGIRVSRSRVLRIMGENSLLSPHRRPPRPANDHDGSITTEAPNVMWGADGAVIPTVEDGNVTLFIVAEHCNGEGLGQHPANCQTPSWQALFQQIQRRVELIAVVGCLLDVGRFGADAAVDFVDESPKAG